MPSRPPGRPRSSTAGSTVPAADRRGPRPRARLEPQAGRPADARRRHRRIHRRRRGKYGRRAASTATAPDRVERNFTATAPNQLWVADITYLRTWEGFVYLAIVVDAFSRKVVGWAMADHLRTELVLDAVGMAITTREPLAGTVHHTDRGSQGGVKRSSQHLVQQGCDVGTNCSVDVDEDRPGADALAGPAAAAA